MKKKFPDGVDRYIGTAKVGPKGQIVIPKEIREMFSIEPGDSLVILADSERGIAIERASFFSKIADAIFSGRAKEVYPEQSEEDSMLFATALEKAIHEEDDDNASND